MATKKDKNSDFVSERLLSLMEQRGISKAQLARELNVSNAHVANWLNGQLPRADQLLSIARHLEVTMEWLLTGSGSAPVRTSPADGGNLKQARTAAEKLARQLGEAEATARTLRGFLGL